MFLYKLTNNNRFFFQFWVEAEIMAMLQVEKETLEALKAKSIAR
jgi:hypothetical protein